MIGIFAVFFTWIIHEFAHWATSELYGYKTIMELNTTSLANGENPTKGQEAIISAAGPLITLLQAFIAFLWLKYRNWNKYIYPFLFITFYMRFLASIMNFVSLNDEGRISVFLEIGTFTLPIIISTVLFYLVYSTSKKHHINWKFQLATIFIVMVTSSVLILADQYLSLRIL